MAFDGSMAGRECMLRPGGTLRVLGMRRMFRPTVLMVTFALWFAVLAAPVGAVATPSLALSTTAGPAGTVFVVTGAGFAPNEVYVLFVKDHNGHSVTSVLVNSDGHGAFTARIDSAQLAVENYRVVALARHQDTPLAAATFSVVDTLGRAFVAPAVTVTPAAGPPGTVFTISGTGFETNTAYTVQSVDAAGNRTADDLSVTTRADGTFEATLTTVAGSTPGVRTVRVVRGGTVVATATFTVSGGAAALFVTPSSGPPGTDFQVRGTGLTPNTAYVLQVADATGAKTANDLSVTTRADGTFEATVTAGTQPGLRTVRLVTPAGALAASTTFTVTLAQPATGGGGMSESGGWGPWLVAGGGALAVTGLLLVSWWRRRPE